MMALWMMQVVAQFVVSEVIGVQMLPNRTNSSTSVWISHALGPCELRMDSAWSRTMSITFEDRDFHKEAKFSGFSTPGPVTFQS